MPSLKDLKNRIASVKATQKITKAMQMVAAAKLRRAQEAAVAARPYSERMAKVLANISAGVAGDDAPKLMIGTGSDHTHLLIVATSERGLCGGFNSSIARKARDKARQLIADGKEVKILCVGKKGAEILRHEFSSLIVKSFTFREVKNIGYVNAQEVGNYVLQMFDNGEFDVCHLYFAQFVSVVQQEPIEKQIIPANISEEEHGSTNSGIYEYEPSEEEILHDLLPRNINVQIFHAMLENGASEQGARMSAMDNATRNAGEMINKLSMTYNRQRQAQITKELIEIISGAEAL